MAKAIGVMMKLDFERADIHGAAQRAVGDGCLRRPQTDAANVLLPEALFQRPKQVLFPAGSRWGVVNRQWNGECPKRTEAIVFAQAGGFDARPYGPGLC